MYIYMYIYICELVGLYLLNRLSSLIDRSIVGLYRGNGLAAMNNANGPKLERIRKDIIALFRDENFQLPSKQILPKQVF